MCCAWLNREPQVPQHDLQKHTGCCLKKFAATSGYTGSRIGNFFCSKRAQPLVLYNSSLISKTTVTYACKTCVLNKAEEEMLVRWERKVLRGIYKEKKYPKRMAKENKPSGVYII